MATKVATRARILTAKKDLVQRQIDELNRNAQIMDRVGGSTSVDVRGEVDFQTKRLDILTWASTQTEAGIRARIAALTTELGTAVAAKYGVVRGLPDVVIDKIAALELLELVVGDHPSSPLPVVDKIFREVSPGVVVLDAPEAEPIEIEPPSIVDEGKK